MGEILDVIRGAKNPLAWLASGRKPVETVQANARAATCITCPKNGTGPLTQWFTEPVAKMLKNAISKRTGHNMTTYYDGALGVCEACNCVLMLKVHEPIDLILKGLKPEPRKKLWENCWILREETSQEKPDLPT